MRCADARSLRDASRLRRAVPEAFHTPYAPQGYGVYPVAAHGYCARHVSARRRTAEGMAPSTRRTGSETSVMFTKITTTALLAGLALATATALPLSGAMAHTTGSHGGKSAGGGHSS